MALIAPQPVPIETDDSIADVFARRVAATPGGTAFREFDAAAQAWREITWAQAAREVARARNALASEGLEPGDRVAIMLRNSPPWVYFDQAAHALGLVVVPLYVEDRPDNIAYCLNDAGVRVLLVEGDEPLKKLAEVRDQVPFLKRIVCVQKPTAASDARVIAMDDWLPGEPSARESPRTGGSTLATIVYTSGTTGKPKGVMLSHQNMLQDVKAALAVYAVYQDDVFLSFLPLSHMFERTAGYYLTLVAGCTVAFARSVALLSEDFKTQRPTVIVSVPRIFERLHGAMLSQMKGASPIRRRLFEFSHQVGWARFEWKQKRGPWRMSFLLWPLLDYFVASQLLARFGGRLRLCVSGGAALNPQIAHTFIGLGLPICQGYGLTEASPVISVNLLEKNDPASIGVALPGITVAFSEKNELLVKGPNVMMGYWNNPEATAKVKSETGWLNTGDLARIENDFLYITGRVKEIIVLGNGEKVPPVDMELAIQLDPLLEQAIVVGEGRNFLAALVSLNMTEWAEVAKANGLPADPNGEGRERAEKFVLARIAERIKGFPGYAQIRKVALVTEKWTVDNGLLTATLKVKRTPILERYQEQMDAIYRRIQTPV